jgi:hypothetical protein
VKAARLERGVLHVLLRAAGAGQDSEGGGRAECNIGNLRV